MKPFDENGFRAKEPRLTMTDYAGDLVALGVTLVCIAVLCFVFPHYTFWR